MLGIGAGWYELEHKAFGIEFGTFTDRFERLDPSFHDRLRKGFREITAAEPGRCVLIDASGEPDAVHRAVCAAVAQRLRAPLGP